MKTWVIIKKGFTGKEAHDEMIYIRATRVHQVESDVPEMYTIRADGMTIYFEEAITFIGEMQNG